MRRDDFDEEKLKKEQIYITKGSRKSMEKKRENILKNAGEIEEPMLT